MKVNMWADAVTYIILRIIQILILIFAIAVFVSGFWS